MEKHKYGTAIFSQECVVDETGCIRPFFRLRNTVTSGFLKYFHEYSGHTVKVTLEILPKETDAVDV